MAQQESSVLFSLNELMGLEQDRIKQEEAERRRAEEAALQARLAQENQVRAEEEARLRAAEEQRRREQQRTREEQARVEAIRMAEIEAARVDAESRARIATLVMQQVHEKEIASLSQDRTKKNLKRLAGFAVVLLIGGAAASAFYVHDAQTKQQQLLAQLNQLNQTLDENNHTITNLGSQLEAAKGDSKKQEEIRAEIAALNERNRQLQIQVANRKPTGAVVAQPAQVLTAHKVTCRSGGTPVASCAPLDPICVCD